MTTTPATTPATTTATTTTKLSNQSIEQFIIDLSSKQPTPGGGASAAITASIGSATASMSAAYTQRKKDETTGAADHARKVIDQMKILQTLLPMADDDVQAYKDLQSTWKKDCTLSSTDVETIQAKALAVPTTLLEACHERIVIIHQFLPVCNPNITSDAKVGIHQLAGSARAAYQTVLVNHPPQEEKDRLLQLLMEIQQIESELLQP